MTKKETPDYEAELIREYEHWEYMKEYGGSDPFYDDAGNMNLTRNHIIHAKKQLEELYVFSHTKRLDHRRSAIRICTSWATRREDVEQLVADIHKYAGK